MSTAQPHPPGMSVDPACQRLGVMRLMLQGRIVHSALKVALLVGTVLNLINNGEQLWMHHSVNLWQAALNFVVPYCVSSYSAARNEAQRAMGDR
jgi:hypothetical protein